MRFVCCHGCDCGFDLVKVFWSEAVVIQLER